MYSIDFSENALKDLMYLRKTNQAVIIQKAKEHLEHEPLRKTRNRKPLRPNALSSWEPRLDEFRVFYDVEEECLEVVIKAVGWKDHNKLYLRGQEYQL